MLFAVNIAVIALAQAADAETYDRGDMGLTVREIQTRLADWGYGPGAVDGGSGADTAAAGPAGSAAGAAVWAARAAVSSA